MNKTYLAIKTRYKVKIYDRISLIVYKGQKVQRLSINGLTNKLIS